MVRTGGHPARPAALVVFDDDEGEVFLDADEAAALLALTGGLDAATVSACPACRSRVLACLALVDVLEEAPAHPRATELVELADDAPTSHCYVLDLTARCAHRNWRDPGRIEWDDAVRRRSGPEPRARR